MKRRVFVAAMAAATLLSSCSDPGGPTSPVNTAVGVEAVSSRTVVGAVNSDVVELPAVKISRVAGGEGIPGRRVVFTLDRPDGNRTNIEVTTGADGIARLPSWRLGNAGVYLATATTEGWGEIWFRILVPGAVVAVYDLKSVDGQLVPSSDWKMYEGHYVLYEGGLYNAFYDQGIEGFSIRDLVLGTYSRAGNDIAFSLEFQGFGGGRAVHSFSGKLSGNELTLQRGHPLDFPVELFVRR